MAALQQQVRAQQQVAEATRAFYESLRKSLTATESEPTRIYEMSEQTFRDSGLAMLPEEQIRVLEKWMVSQGIGIRVVKEKRIEIISPSTVWPE